MIGRKCYVLLVVGTLVLAALVAGRPVSVAQAAPGYVFEKLATLGDPAPKGGFHINDFEPQGINNRGDVMFATDMSTGGEGVFLRSRGVTTEVMRSGDPAPGGLTFGGFGIFSWGDISNLGHAAFTFGTEPTDWSKPLGWDSEVVRLDGWDPLMRRPGSLTAIMIPHVTNAPGGGKFHGSIFNTGVNSYGEVTFAGIIDTPDGRYHQPDLNLGMGIYRADKAGTIINVASPGDPSPGGGTFDALWDTRINDRGDVVFGGHEVGQECPGNDPSSLLCWDNTYIRRAVPGTRSGNHGPALGPVQVIARQGDPAPGGGTFAWAWGGRLNSSGDVAYIGWLGPLDTNWGLYANRAGTNGAVARQGYPAPGGGNFKAFGCSGGSFGINDLGQIAFGAVLDQDANGDGVDDSGMYVAGPSGSINVVARTGTVMPGVGTVVHVGYVFSCVAAPGGEINNRGQVLLQVTLTNGKNVLVTATP
jgi:hypothetical protein